MPILDGYKATQQIRHQAITTKVVGLINIPIVAMTASAIQGDKEKCKKAGMDDYLAKPVKGKVLEKMLVKWAIEGRRRRHAAATSAIAPVDEDTDDSSDPAVMLHRERSEPVSLANSLDTQEGRDLMTSGRVVNATESEGARHDRRAAADEKASQLRDEKLLSVSEGPHDYLEHQPHQIQQQQHHALAAGQPTHALTLENIGKFDSNQAIVDDEGKITEALYRGETMPEALTPSSRNGLRPGGVTRESDQTIRPKSSQAIAKEEKIPRDRRDSLPE